MLADSPFNGSVTVFEVGFRRTFAMRLVLLRGIFFMCVVLLGWKMIKRERKYGLVKLCFHGWCGSTVDICECRTSTICRLGCSKVIGMTTFLYFAGESLEWMQEVLSINVGVRYARCKCGLARRYCIHLSTIYKVPRSVEDMHLVCVDDVLAEEDIFRWKLDFCSSHRKAWHDSGCVESGD